MSLWSNDIIVECSRAGRLALESKNILLEGPTVVDGEVIYWIAKGCFSVGKVPIKELRVGVSDKSCLVVSPGEDIFLKSC